MTTKRPEKRDEVNCACSPYSDGGGCGCRIIDYNQCHSDHDAYIAFLEDNEKKAWEQAESAQDKCIMLDAKNAELKGKYEYLSQYSMCMRHETDNYAHGGAAVCLQCHNSDLRDKDIKIEGLQKQLQEAHESYDRLAADFAKEDREEELKKVLVQCLAPLEVINMTSMPDMSEDLRKSIHLAIKYGREAIVKYRGLPKPSIGKLPSGKEK